MSKQFIKANVQSVAISKASADQPIVTTPFIEPKYWPILGRNDLGINRRIERPDVYWDLEELAGNRYPNMTNHGEWGDELGSSPVLEERNWLGLDSEITYANGLQDRGKGVSFTVDRGQYLTCQYLQMYDDRLAINLYAKITTTNITAYGAPVIVMAPKQGSRRNPRYHDPGNYFAIGVVKVGSNYHYRVFSGYLFETGFAWLDSVTCTAVNIGSGYYQVCAWTSHELDVSENVINKKLHISVNNNPTVTDRTGGPFVAMMPKVFIAENEPMIAFGELSDEPEGLVVDKVSIYNGIDITEGMLSAFFNGGAGFDPTNEVASQTLSFYQFEEALGEDRLPLVGTPVWHDTLAGVSRVTGGNGLSANSADFAGSNESYLELSKGILAREIAIGLWVKFDEQVAKTCILGWLTTIEGNKYGYDLYHEADVGFVLEVGVGTPSTVRAYTPGEPALPETTGWYFLHFGFYPSGLGGDAWIGYNNIAFADWGVNQIVNDATPAWHDGPMYLGRDYVGNGAQCLNGKVDCLGIYRTFNESMRNIIYQYQFYPFR